MFKFLNGNKQKIFQDTTSTEGSFIEKWKKPTNQVRLNSNNLGGIQCFPKCLHSNYNYGNFIIPAIESIVNQTYKGEIHIYVVDDGSSDDSWKRFQAMGNIAFLFTKRIENSGASVSKCSHRDVSRLGGHYWCARRRRRISSRESREACKQTIEHDELGVFADYDNVNPEIAREFKPYYSFMGLRTSHGTQHVPIKKKYLDMVRLPNGEFSIVDFMAQLVRAL